jgi:hypothetical protein
MLVAACAEGRIERKRAGEGVDKRSFVHFCPKWAEIIRVCGDQSRPSVHDQLGPPSFLEFFSRNGCYQKGL